MRRILSFHLKMNHFSCEESVLTNEEDSQLSPENESSSKDELNNKEKESLGILDILNRLDEVADTLICRLCEQCCGSGSVPNY